MPPPFVLEMQQAPFMGMAGKVFGANLIHTPFKPYVYGQGLCLWSRVIC
jgi:hypothetical protein